MKLVCLASTVRAADIDRLFAKGMVAIVVCCVSIAGTVRASEPDPKTVAEKWISAISNDRTDLLKTMLNMQLEQQSGSVAMLQQDAPNGKSALMVAAKQGDLVLVQRMVQLGADINELTKTGGTPFMFAVLGNHIDVADWLRSKGADINAKGSNGWSAATIAGAKGQADMLRWLIDSGADINSPDVYRFTPLMRAVDNQHTESAQVLLDRGRARVDFKDESDNTALHFAVANKQRVLVELLLKHGANPMDANRDGITPIDLAKQQPALADLISRQK